ncbi:MAG: hypothetical protein U0793_17640 [Gemmataceae bacterium]
MTYFKATIAAATLACCGLLFFGGGAGDAGDKKLKIDPKILKKILGKIDPEIKAAQVQLVAARKAIDAATKRIKAALVDEVLGEKGPTELKAIDELKLALKASERAHNDIVLATKHANLAQFFDKSGD